MADPMQVEVTTWHIVEAADELDMATAPDLRHSLMHVINEGNLHVVLDLTKVTFIDSSGFAVLITALKRLRASGGDLRLAGAGSAAMAAMRVSGLDHVFALYRDAAAATFEQERRPDADDGRQQ